MLQVKINNSQAIDVDTDRKNLLIDGVSTKYELIRKNERSFTIIKANRIFNIEVLSIEEKLANLSINNKPHTIEVTDHIDQILEKLGMDNIQANVIKEIKAPMPGSILSIQVQENSTVAAGDPLMVLEAMKMENVIKSPGDGVVSRIHISEKENVEKNQVLLTFD